jgi:hypothetical protein
LELNNAQELHRGGVGGVSPKIFAQHRAGFAQAAGTKEGPGVRNGVHEVQFISGKP